MSVERGKRPPLFTCGEGVVTTYMYTLLHSTCVDGMEEHYHYVERFSLHSMP